MARAAVRAKQAQAAQAQAAVKPSRKQRKHASGGNPNQDLFFARLQRKQKWVFAVLAIVFAFSFVLLGIGSGAGGGLEQSVSNAISGWFGGTSGGAVGKAQGEIKTNPLKGYKDLADAYVTENNLTGAVGALQSYVKLNKKNWTVWEQLGGYQKQLGDTAAGQYQQALQNGQLTAPGTIFEPRGPLAGQLGSNPINDYYSQQAQSVTQPLLQQAIAGYRDSLLSLQKAAKYAPAAKRGEMILLAASAAQAAGNTTAELAALKRYVQLSPNSPNIKQIEAQCQQLGGSCTPNGKK